MDLDTVYIKETQHDKVCVIGFPSTLADALYDSLPDLVESQLLLGKKCFIFDFQYTQIIQSPAVACILECAEKISDSSNRSLVVCGLSEMNEKIFEMVGLFLYGNCCQNEEQAINDLDE